MIKRNSDKRAKQERLYKKLRQIFLTKNPFCEIRIRGCTGRATQIHHISGRQGELLTDLNNFLAVCYSCHDWIERNPKAAKDLGYSKNRLTNGRRKMD